jgi:hypothetical protein
MEKKAGSRLKDRKIPRLQALSNPFSWKGASSTAEKSL